MKCLKATVAALVIAVLWGSAPGVSLAQKAALPLADGELFVSQKIVDGGKVLYKGTTATDNWNHDPEVTPDGFVGTAFVPRQVVLEKIDVAGVGHVKRMYTAKEKIQGAQQKYHGKAYDSFLVIYTAMDTEGRGGQMAIQKAELFGRLLNVTVAIDDPKRTDTHEDEALFTESALCLPLKELPQYGTLLVRFADVTGHGLGLQYVQLQL